MGKAVGVLWDLHVASWCPCMPGESRVAWSGCCACDSDPEHEPGERAAVPWHEPAAGNERLLVPQPHKGGGGRAGLGMQQGPCAEAPALQGRGTAVPAVAAARARAIGGGPRTGTCWIYGPSHDVFMAGMGQPQMLPSPALHGTARHGTARRVPALHPGADRAEVSRWTLLFEVELPGALPGTAAVSAHCRAARQLLPCPLHRQGPGVGAGTCRSCPVLSCPALALLWC